MSVSLKYWYSICVQIYNSLCSFCPENTGLAKLDVSSKLRFFLDQTGQEVSVLLQCSVKKSIPFLSSPALAEFEHQWSVNVEEQRISRAPLRPSFSYDTVPLCLLSYPLSFVAYAEETGSLRSKWHLLQIFAKCFSYGVLQFNVAHFEALVQVGEKKKKTFSTWVDAVLFSFHTWAFLKCFLPLLVPPSLTWLYSLFAAYRK